METNRN